MICGRLKCGTSSGLDIGLVGLLANIRGNELSRPHYEDELESLVTQLDVGDLFHQLETNQLQLGVVSLEHLLDYAIERPSTSVRIVGQLLGGDCRALVSLSLSPRALGARTVGAAHPQAAFARWEDISCAFDLECHEDRAEEIPSAQLSDALNQGRHALIELNSYWEGLMGCRRGLIRSSARAADYGIPVGVSHLLISNQLTISQNRQSLTEFRALLVEIYHFVLNNTDAFAEQWKRSNDFRCRPDCGFLFASARILAPHLEGFIRNSGKFSLPAMMPFLRWFESRVRGSVDSPDAFAAGVWLERLLCDVWN